MKSDEELKSIVKERYSLIVQNSGQSNASACCSTSSCCGAGDVVMADDYTHLIGYVPEADLGLGCGLPTQSAGIKSGDTVVDLGSGAGNDAFVARSEVGPFGRVIGIDMTAAMLEKARSNAKARGYSNVEFLYGEVEKIPLPNETADVVVSNCVMNLVPNKEKAFQETWRILKRGGHFNISDIVLSGDIPASLRNVAALYAGCISGAETKTRYLDIISKAGFTDVQVKKEKRIQLPKALLQEHLSDSEMESFLSSDIGIYSITVYGKKE